jgi:hypothetical protein
MAPAICFPPCKGRGRSSVNRRVWESASDGDLSLVEKYLAESSHLIAAYELILRALDLMDRKDPLTAMIADKII